MHSLIHIARELVRGSIVMAAIGAAPLAHAAAVDYFLKLDGIDGEAASASHPKWIQVDGIQLGMARSESSSASTFSLSFNTLPNRATPVLMERCAEGQHTASGRVEFLRRENHLLLFYELDLRGVTVRSVTLGGGDAVRHEIELGVTWLEWTYTAYDVSEKPVERESAYWDLVKNQGGFIAKPIFRASGGINEDGGFSLNWGAIGGRVYRVMTSRQVQGPYLELQRYTAASSGEASLNLPIEISNRFFYLEEVTD